MRKSTLTATDTSDRYPKKFCTPRRKLPLACSHSSLKSSAWLQQTTMQEENSYQFLSFLIKNELSRFKVAKKHFFNLIGFLQSPTESQSITH